MCFTPAYCGSSETSGYKSNWAHCRSRTLVTASGRPDAFSKPISQHLALICKHRPSPTSETVKSSIRCDSGCLSQNAGPNSTMVFTLLPNFSLLFIQFFLSS